MEGSSTIKFFMCSYWRISAYFLKCFFRKKTQHFTFSFVGCEVSPQIKNCSLGHISGYDLKIRNKNPIYFKWFRDSTHNEHIRLLVAFFFPEVK